MRLIMIMRADCTKTDAERQASAKNNKPPQHVDRALPNTNKRGGRAAFAQENACETRSRIYRVGQRVYCVSTAMVHVHFSP